MSNRSQERGSDWKYHRVAKSGEDGMRDWMGKDAEPGGMVTLLKGPDSSWLPEGIIERGEEYLAILRQMADRRYRQPADYKYYRRVDELNAGIDDDTGKQRTQEKTAEILSQEFGRPISQPDVSRDQAKWNIGWKGHVKGNSISVGKDYKREPPFDYSG